MPSAPYGLPRGLRQIGAQQKGLRRAPRTVYTQINRPRTLLLLAADILIRRSRARMVSGEHGGADLNCHTIGALAVWPGPGIYQPSDLAQYLLRHLHGELAIGVSSVAPVWFVTILSDSRLRSLPLALTASPLRERRHHPVF